MVDERGGFAPVYGVELLYEEPPQIDREDLLRSMRTRCGRVDPMKVDEEESAKVYGFVFRDHEVKYADIVAPAQAFVVFSDKVVEAGGFEIALQQTWDWDGAREAVGRCRSWVMVTDMMASGLEYRERLELFHNVLVSVLEVSRPEAIHWMQCERIVDPTAYMAARQEGSEHDPIYPAINVRLFKLQDRAKREALMDSLGLAAFGLPDVQCRFFELDVSEMADVLYGVAYYIFRNGDVIKDGEMVPGVRGEGEWVCQHGVSLVEPTREVLDINPGGKYAAGTRNPERPH